MCSAGFQPTEEQDECVRCDVGLYSDPLGGVLCTPCKSLENLGLCESVRGPSLEECFWIEGNESKLDSYCVNKV
jgi:hypothetical protein